MFLNALGFISAVNTEVVGLAPGANSTTIVNYNASAVKFYNAVSSLVRLKNKNIFFALKKRSSILQRWR
jgi:hypothetical protein